MDFFELEKLRQIRSNKFFTEACNHYGISGVALDTLLKDYDLEPKGAYGPQGHDPVPLQMREIAEKVELPVKVVGRLQDMGVIGSPITCDDFDFLKKYKKTWGVIFFLKVQLAKYSQKQREEIMTRPELSNKWEKWIYSRYFFNEIEYGHGGRMLNPEKRINIDDLAEQVDEIFHVPNCHNTRNHIKKIREMANNDKKKVFAGKATEKSVLRSRSLPESEFDFFTETFDFNMIS